MKSASSKKTSAVAIFLLRVLAVLAAAVTLGQSQNPQGTGQTGRRDPAAKPAIITIPADSPQLRQLRSETVRIASVPKDEIVAPGRIVFDVGRVSRVLLPTTGRVSRVLVRLGETVAAGQPLLELDSPDAESAIAECRQAEAILSQARATLTKTQADYERIGDLLVHKAVARKDLLAAENELAQARAALEQANAALAHCRRRLEILGLRPGEAGQKVTVRATLAGKVIDLAVTEGEYRSDTGTPLMTVADLSTVWVTSEIPENSIRFVEVGERVQVELVAFPGEVFDARVTRIADTVDSKTRTIQVQAELRNPNGRLRPEMFGRIRHSHAPQSLPVVPAQAIVRGALGSFVFVERGPGIFERIMIQTGEPASGAVPVLQGLKPGDRVVVAGAMLLAGMEKH
jgi:cobalt-zinc-cadmium efflux system membrane fusion protein